MFDSLVPCVNFLDLCVNLLPSRCSLGDRSSSQHSAANSLLHQPLPAAVSNRSPRPRPASPARPHTPSRSRRRSPKQPAVHRPHPPPSAAALPQPLTAMGLAFSKFWSRMFGKVKRREGKQRVRTVVVGDSGAAQGAEALPSSASRLSSRRCSPTGRPSRRVRSIRFVTLHAPHPPSHTSRWIIHAHSYGGCSSDGDARRSQRRQRTIGTQRLWPFSPNLSSAGWLLTAPFFPSFAVAVCCSRCC